MSNATGKGGSTPAGQTTSTTTQPSYMYPYIGTALSQAGSLLGGNGPQYYPAARPITQPQKTQINPQTLALIARFLGPNNRLGIQP